MSRYHEARTNISIRCRICENIEEFIKIRKDEVKKNRDLLEIDDPAGTRDFVLSEIEDMELEIKFAQQVIEEIMGNLKGV